MPMTPERLNERLAEAARYAVLRRLAPAIRHDIAGVLQPISMMAAMLEKRIRKPDPDLVALASNSAAISAMSREAAGSCMSLMTWLAPKENTAVALNEGIADCISLVQTELSFRGFTLVNKTADVQAELPRNVLRSVFMAALLTLTDEHEGPGDVVLAAVADGAGVSITMSVVPNGGDAQMPSPQNYRELQWDDVRAIAAVEQVEIMQSAARLELRCPLSAGVGPGAGLS